MCCENTDLVKCSVINLSVVHSVRVLYLFCQTPALAVLAGSLRTLSRRSVRAGRPGGRRM